MIQGRLVHLRPVEIEDLPFLTWLANDAGVRSLVVGWSFPIPLHGQERWLTASQEQGSVRRLAVVDTEADTTIGLTGLWELDWHNQSAMTATKLDRSRSPKGAGSDAIMTTMAWAFHEVGLRRLHSSILDFNHASMAAYVRKCGWRIEGIDREAVFRKGSWCDVYRVAILRREFDALEAANEYVERIAPISVDDKVSVDKSAWVARPDTERI